MKARELIFELERLGIHLQLDNGDLRYRSPKGALTPDLRRELQNNKEAVISFLQQRQREGGDTDDGRLAARRRIGRRCVHQLFEAQVEKSPHSLAVDFAGQRLTYGELNARANRLAHSLREMGIGHEALVPFCLPRSLDMMVAMLAILKSGAAYVPLDPTYPSQRLRLILDDIRGSVLLTHAQLAADLPAENFRLLCVDRDWPTIETQQDGNLANVTTPDSLAYVIYTSGSTGKPKGVCVSHVAIDRLVMHTDYISLAPSDRIAQASTATFDAATFEIWGALLSGAQLVGISKETMLSPEQFAKTLRDEQISTLFITTALFNQIATDVPSAFAPLKHVLFGGEAVNPHWVRQVLRHGPPDQLLHVYGPTETTTFATWFRVSSLSEEATTLPIGKPISNTETALLDSHFNVLPIGVPGELYIGGPGLARAYLGHPELTAERFVPDRLQVLPGQRLYRTGDLCRWTADGDIEFLGRVDHQVKLRGFRIELGEIETALRGHPSVHDAVVLVREDSPGDKRLVGYFVAGSTDREVGADPHGHADQVARWLKVYDNVIYTNVNGEATAGDPAFNIAGWISSYTGEPIPAVAMREQVDQAVDKILQLGPRRVLEIGCGTGLLLFRIAPRCESYCGTDFSQVALDYTQRWVTEQNLTGVRLLNRLADNFEGFPTGSFDVVILNSVVQYFPSVDYLLKVLASAIQVLAPGGHLFLGDIRHLPLLESFQALVQLHKAPDSLSRERLLELVREQVSHEQELVVDPAFFAVLKQRLAGIRDVEILLKRGRHHNELTQFRYDVMLHVGQEQVPVSASTAVRWLDWEIERLTLPRLCEQLEREQPNILGICGVPNARVMPATRARQLMVRADGPATAGQIRRTLTHGLELAGVDPEDVWRLSDQLPYDVDITWSQQTEGGFDVLLRRRGGFTGGGPSPRPEFPRAEANGRPWSDYASHPLRSTAQKLIPELRRFLSDQLPDYMVPAAFVGLDEFPLNRHGKVDRGALPAPEGARPELETLFVAPEGDVEQRLAGIWSQVLGVDRVGVNDNFFALGGDSILAIQVISQAEKAGLHLTPRQIFQHQAISELAKVVGRKALIIAEQGIVHGPVPLTPIQRWFLEQDPAERHHFNQAVHFRLEQSLDGRQLRTIVESLLRHHDALRLRLVPSPEGWQQVNAAEDAADASSVLLHIDLGNLNHDDQTAVMDDLAAELQASLDLTSGPIIRVAYLDLGAAGGSQLLIIVHHLAIDGVSWRILLEDLQQAFIQLSQRRPAVELPAKTTSFKQWAERLAAYAAAGELEQEAPFWIGQAAPSSAPLPRDLEGKPNTVASSREVTVDLTREETQALLKEVPLAYRTQINEVLLAALVEACAGWLGGRRLYLNLEGHGREELFHDVNVGRTVGWFTSLFPVILDLSEVEGTGGQLLAAKEQLRRIPQRGIGYGLLRYLGRDTRLAEQLRAAPQPQISFNYLGQFGSESPDASPLTMVPLSPGPLQSPRGERAHLIDVNASVAAGQLHVHWIYSESIHHRGTIERLAQRHVGALREIIAHCQSPEAGGYSPSDFPLAEIDQGTLHRLLGNARDVEDLYPLSPLQSGLLFQSLYAPEMAVYFEQFSCLIEDQDFDATSFQAAWQQAVQRHPILRTGFAWKGLERPLQVVYRNVTLPCEVLDWSDLSRQEQESRLDEYLRGDRQRGFDLAQHPLIRIAFLRLSDGWNFVLSHHHVLLDGWSLGQLLKEVLAIDRASRQGHELRLSDVPPYRNYIAWLQEQPLAAAEKFWRQALAGFRRPISFRLERPYGSFAEDEFNTYETRVGEQEVHLSQQTTSRLVALARRHSLSLNTLVQGAWALVLSCYSGEDDVVFGTVSSGRPPALDGVESMVGLFINTLPVRMRVDWHAPLLSWLKTLQEQATEARQYEYAPLHEVQQWSDVPRGQPLFDSLLTFENYYVDESFRTAGTGLNMTRFRFFEITNYGSGLLVGPGKQLSLRFLYDRRRFDDAARQMPAHLKTLLEEISLHPERKLCQFSLLDATEQEQLVVQRNKAGSPAVLASDFQEQIDQQVAQSGDAVALESGNRGLTYRALQRQVNQLAERLRTMGIGPEVMVGLCTEPSLETVVGLLAILQAGGCCVPLDPTWSAEEMKLAQEQLGIGIVLTDTCHHTRFLASSASVVAIDVTCQELTDVPRVPPAPAAMSDRAAYICLTFQLGQPVGTVIDRRGLASLVRAQQQVLGIHAADRVLQFAPLSSTDAIGDAIVPLTCGATLHCSPHRLPSELDKSIRDRGITVAVLPPATLAALPHQSFPNLRTIVAGGERCSPHLVRRWASGRRLFHAYGSHQLGGRVLIGACHADDRRLAALGPLIPNMRISILDRHLHPVPLGVPGELYLSGAGVARAFYRRADLAADRLIPDPFADRPGQRLQKTADVCRWRADGLVEFCHASASPVYVRDRLALVADILRVLEEHPGVRQVAVLVQGDAADAAIVAYVVPDGDSLTPDQLRKSLRARFPQTETPAHFVFLSALPLTNSGKLDRAALPSPPANDLIPAARARVMRIPGEELDELADHTNLTKNQLLIWAGQMLHPDLPVYNIGAVLLLDGPGDIDHARSTVEALVAGVEALRTVIELDDGIPRARVVRTMDNCFSSEDFSSAQDPEQSFRDWASRRTGQPFDLGKRLFEFVFVQISAKRHGVYINHHHLVTDGWSCSLIVRLFNRLYRQALEGRPVEPPDTPAFSDYVEFEREKRSSEAYQKAREYWRTKLAEEIEPIGFYGGNSCARSLRVDRFHFDLGHERSRRVRELASGEGLKNLATFNIFAAVLLTYLHRVSGNQRLSIGTPLLNRPSKKFKQTVGLFMQVAPLRFEISPDETFESLMGKVSTELKETMRYQRYVTGNPPQQPVYDVILNYEFAHMTDDDGRPLETETFYKGIAHDSLAILVRDYEMSGQFTLDIDFSRDVFNREQRDRAVQHLYQVMDSFLDDPRRQLCTVDLLTSAELRQVTHEFSDGEVLPSLPPQVVSAFECAAATWPGHRAVIEGDRSLTYQELNVRANQLGRYLISLGVGPDTVVAICMPKSLETVIGVLAVIKAGGAYLPLDPNYPRERLRFMLQDSGARVLLTTGSAGQLSDGYGGRVVSLDAANQPWSAEDTDNLPIRADRHHLAYLIYTSGSTGQSKGVMVSRASLANAFAGWARAFKLEATDVHLQMASFSFDVCTGDFVRALCSGGTLVLCPTETLLAADQLHELMRAHRVTCAEFVPAVLRNLLDYLASSQRTLELGRLLIVGSDTWYVSEHQNVRSQLPLTVRLVHSYGITEATIDSCFFEGELAHDGVGMAPVGRPFANTQMYVVDENSKPVPKGVRGELYLGGPNLARGYARRPAQTAERFVPNPFAARPGEKLYKSGDRARWWEDGNLEFLGRQDNQVKVRGFRVELGEIESALRQHPALEQAVVVARDVEGRSGEKQLIGYVVAKGDARPSIGQLRRDLRSKLPEYMIPSAFVLMNELPMLPNGKIDRRQLPEFTATRPEIAAEYVAPSSPLEIRLAEIWSQALGIERVGIHDNFFDLGGHSLVAIRLVTRVRESLDVEIPLAALFENPSIAGLRDAIEVARLGGSSATPQQTDLASEVTLDSSIRVQSLERVVAPPRRVLLTGATGYLGAFLLHELIEQTRAQIVCLVRAADDRSAREKIRKNLAGYSLPAIADNERIVPVLGDLTQLGFGMPTPDFESLADSIDAIYHSGAMGNATYPYSAHKPTNVLGTQQVLRLAARRNVAPVHYVSTISMIPTNEYWGGGTVPEREVFDGSGLLDGYSQSKWVAERIMFLGATRGIPIAVYRPGRITGNSTTGTCSTNDVLFLILKGLIQLGAVPDIQFKLLVDMTPVDYVSKAIIALSRKPSESGRVFHLINPEPMTWHDLMAQIERLGYPLRTLPPQEWFDRWQQFAKKSPEYGVLGDFFSYAFHQLSQGQPVHLEPPRYDCSNTLAGLDGTAISCPPLDSELLAKYFSYFVSSGFLTPPDGGVRR